MITINTNRTYASCRTLFNPCPHRWSGNRRYRSSRALRESADSPAMIPFTLPRNAPPRTECDTTRSLDLALFHLSQSQWCCGRARSAARIAEYDGGMPPYTRTTPRSRTGISTSAQMHRRMTTCFRNGRRVGKQFIGKAKLIPRRCRSCSCRYSARDAGIRVKLLNREHPFRRAVALWHVLRE